MDSGNSGKRQREPTRSSSEDSDTRSRTQPKKLSRVSASVMLSQDSGYPGFRAGPGPARTAPTSLPFGEADLGQPRSRDSAFSQTYGPEPSMEAIPPQSPVNAPKTCISTNIAPPLPSMAFSTTLPGFNELDFGQYSPTQPSALGAPGAPSAAGDMDNKLPPIVGVRQRQGSSNAFQRGNDGFEERQRRTSNPLGSESISASPFRQRDPGQLDASSLSAYQPRGSITTSSQKHSRMFNTSSYSQPPATRNYSPQPKLSEHRSLQPPARSDHAAYDESPLDDGNLTTLSEKVSEYPQAEAVNNDGKPGEKPFPCPYCNKPLASARGVQRHIEGQHEDRITPGKPERKMHPCGECEKKFDSPSALKRHQGRRHDISENIYCCPAQYCPREYAVEKDLKDHIRNKHTDLRGSDADPIVRPRN